MRQFLGANDMMAYLTMMARRTVELHRVLKPTGSHYLKLLEDSRKSPLHLKGRVRVGVKSFASNILDSGWGLRVPFGRDGGWASNRPNTIALSM